ncbi:citrate transporter [Pseudonocardia sediminis]|uniref:Citrate transporter n=1 Tax=Pseudonocardia sediminis TaxID=1397368 RepID=A0A4Q7UWZ0_PSEST|nr:SLC13 family permease [Pseudonocardia sediminis]RZT86275.1 citrate transporter [Pseudonocardia sediminis]
MVVQIVALVIFAGVFLIAEVRRSHIGIVMFAAACGVGLLVTGLPLDDILGGFPVDILILLVGVTYFFGIAKSNGTIARLVDLALARVGDNVTALPLVFFALTGVVSAMGSPLGGLVMAPIGMSVAGRRGIDPMLMGLAMACGLSAGGFAPTSLFGIVTYGTAASAGIALNPLVLFGTAVVANVLLLGLAYLLFGPGAGARRARRGNGRVVAAGSPGLDGRDGAGSAPAPREQGDQLGAAATTTDDTGGDRGGDRGGARTSAGPSGTDPTATRDPGDDTGGRASDATGSSPDRSAPPVPEPFEREHRITVLAMLGLVVAVVVLALMGSEPDIGVLAFAFGAALTLIDPPAGRTALAEIDWSTVLLVGGIITYVGVLQTAGAVDLLGDLAAGLAFPVPAAFVLCAVCGLISAFASTTGILAALVPLAIPLVQTGGVPGWALICALGVCSSLVDVSPFSTVGATMVATATDPEERPRMTSLLTRWGMSMVVVGPVLLLGTLMLPAMAV